MAEAVVSVVVESLRDLLVQEATFLKGVRNQVEQMKTELEFIKAYLKDADKKQIIDETVRTYVSNIREAAYDAEDVIETFALKIESRRRGGSIKNAFKRYACILNEAAELHKVGSKIEAIKTRITISRGWLDSHGIQRSREGEEGPSSVVERQRQRRQSYSHVDEEYTVGLEGDVKKLVEELLNEEKQCRVVSICGMGGLGKTTLAKKVYHHQDIRRRFDGFAWVFLSQQFQRRNIWEGILFNLIFPSDNEREKEKKKSDDEDIMRQRKKKKSDDEDIMRQRIRNMSDDEVAAKLYQVQEDKKYLVVLDDIWTMEAWDILRPAFPVGNSGSKILLTGRNNDVAVYVEPRCLLHEPRCLAEKEGWALLQRKAFPGESDGEIVEDMKKLGVEMVKRCGGLPLAIVVLGGILATKHKDEWKMVNDQINSYLTRGKGHETQQLGVREILALSYYELPYQLKPCFLHLGHFPENFSIPTKKLVQMWVAEGFVSPMQYEVRGAETLEEIAECYLGELLNRNMVQVGEKGSTGRVKTCRLHDLMRDLCLLKANEENFLKIFDNQDGNELMGDSISSTITSAKLSQQIRRIAIGCKERSGEIIFWKSERTPNLRSLLVTSTLIYAEHLEKMIFELCNFKLLKVLDLEAHRIETLPRAVGDLIHLRYLNVSFGNSLKVPSSFGNLRSVSHSLKVPSSIGNLRCLQTLIICDRFLHDSIEIPNIIWKIEQLRHLCLPYDGYENGVKLGLGNLRELQTLKNFDARVFDVKELTKLTNLRTLKILNLRSLKVLEGALLSDSLNGLRSLGIELGGTEEDEEIEETDLQRLLLSCHQLRKLFLRGEIVKLPEYSKFPPNLTKLSLMCSFLVEDPMPTVEKLPNLTVLLLDWCSYTKQMTCSANGFPQLKSLQLTEWHLEEWCVQEEAMRSLCQLKINDCKKLKMVPDGLRFITTLRELHIIYMPQEFQKRVKEGGEDFDKLKHVPSIIVEKSPL